MYLKVMFSNIQYGKFSFFVRLQNIVQHNIVKQLDFGFIFKQVLLLNTTV